MFVDLNPDTEKIIYSHFTCATGNDLMTHILIFFSFFSPKRHQNSVKLGRHGKHQARVLRSKGHNYASCSERVWNGLKAGLGISSNNFAIKLPFEF